MDGNGSERFDTVIVGAGQAGLSAGYHLKEAGRSFVILDANDRIGGSWRTRYDSLQLFTPSWAVKLPGWRFPKRSAAAPLEGADGRLPRGLRRQVRPARADRGPGGADLPGRGPVRRVPRRRSARGRPRDRRLRGATATRGSPRSAASSTRRSSRCTRATTATRRSSATVGSWWSGRATRAPTSRSTSRARTRTWLSGPDRGHVPVSIDTWVARNVVFRIIRFVGVHVLTLRTPIGRRAKVKYASKGDMLVRVKPKQILAAGVERVPKTVGVTDGMPTLEDGRVLDVANVIWCTGLPSRPVVDRSPDLRRGRRARARAGRGDESEPGLYFVGLIFQYSAGSDVIPGVPRDAKYVVERLLERERSGAAPETVAA